MFQGRCDFFDFDGRSSEYLGWRIVQVGNADFETNFGAEYKVETVEGINGRQDFVRATADLQELPITICKMNAMGNPLPVTNKEIQFLIDWLKTDENKILVANGLVYKGMFAKSGTQVRKQDEYCYINLTFKMAEGWCNRKQVNSGVKIVNNTYNIELESKATINKNNIPLVMRVKLLGDTSNITITNISTGVKFTMNGITDELDKEFEINDFDGNEFITNLQDNTRNLAKLLEKPRDFIYLRKGKNRIKVECDGKAKILFTYIDNYQIGM